MRILSTPTVCSPALEQSSSLVLPRSEEDASDTRVTACRSTRGDTGALRPTEGTAGVFPFRFLVLSGTMAGGVRSWDGAVQIFPSPPETAQLRSLKLQAHTTSLYCKHTYVFVEGMKEQHRWQ